MSAPKQLKSKAPKTWIPSYSSLQPYTKSFYKFVIYYIIDIDYNIDTWTIRKQVAGYIMSLKRKQRVKLKAKGYAEGRYHHIFNIILESSYELLQSNTHKRCCMLNTTNYNNKLRSVIGQENDSKVTNWTCFDKQTRDTFLYPWMISQKLVDHTNIGRAICRILDKVYASSVSMRDSIGSVISFSHTSMVLHPRSDDHLHLREFIHKRFVIFIIKETIEWKSSIGQQRTWN